MRHPTLHALLLRNATLYAHRTALVCDDRRSTHEELLRSAVQAANAYASQGVKPGDRVAILARNSIEMVQALCACEVSGFVAVPLNHRLADAELAVIVHDCTPTLVICDEEFRSSAENIHASTAQAFRILVVAKDPHDAGSFQSLMRESSAVPDGKPPEPNDAAYIIYTSGSTGKPKGVVLSHAGLVESGRLLAAPAGVRPDSVQIVVMPLFHVGATAQRMGYLVHGGTLVLHGKFDAERIVAELSSGDITDIHLAPTMLRSVLDAIGGRQLDFSRLESVKYASSPIPEDTLARAMRHFGSKLLQYYALTEAGGIASVLHKFVHVEAMQGDRPGRLRSAGQAHLGCEIQLRHPDGRPCQRTEEGEIWLRSAAMMLGYWNNTELTSATVVDGWLRTGDAARYDEESYLYIMDRLKDMIVSGGENIYSSEVERTLEAHPHVLEAAVIGVPDARWGESVKAYVVLRPGAPDLSEDTLIDFCKEHMASYKKPRTIEFLASLPRLQHVQKIDKVSLRKPHWGEQQRAVN
jgi:acyl-CoA synthetase (AMP-forming)/AMP-acid ligase II